MSRKVTRFILAFLICGEVFHASANELCQQSLARFADSIAAPSLQENQLHQLRTVHTIWDTREFDKPRLPIPIGKVRNPSEFSHPRNIRIESMPVKMPGTDYRLPPELEQFRGALGQIAEYERQINPHVDQYYTYVTINQGEVAPGRTQRRPGAHSDGFQEDYLNRQTIVDRNYLVSDGIPTEFFDQPFPISHLTDASQVLPEFDRLVDLSKMVTFEPYTITMMDTYTVHRGGMPTAKKHRTFLKVVFSTGKFNRFGNTHNPLFDYQWEMVPRGAGRNSSVAPMGCPGVCSQCNLH